MYICKYIKGAENSSIMASYTDYLSLFPIWVKAYNTLNRIKQLKEDNIYRITNKILGLLESYFLHTLSLIRFNLSKVNSVFDLLGASMHSHSHIAFFKDLSVVNPLL